MEHRWVYARKSSIIENQKIFWQPTNVDTVNKVQNNNSNSNYNSKGINITQNRFRGFRSIRM
jgi:hypothetical protein